MRPTLAAFTALALLAGATNAPPASGSPQSPSEPSAMMIDVSRIGPQVGERVPDFALEDQSGTTRTLPSIMGPKGAMLVFFRSADW